LLLSLVHLPLLIGALVVMPNWRLLQWLLLL
jgi:hypothetical protein